MGILDIFKSNKSPKTTRALSSLGSITTAEQLAEALDLIGEEIGKSDYTKNFKEGYVGNPYVNACINKKTTAAKQPVWEIWMNKRQIDKKPTVVSPNLSLWNMFYENHFYTGCTWDDIVAKALTYMDLAGEYFLYMPDPDAALRGNGYITFLEPDNVEITATEYLIKKDGKLVKTIPKEVMVNGKRFQPVLHKANWNKGEIRGLSRLTPAYASVKITNQGAQWNYNLLKNGARPSMLMMFDSTGLDMTAEKWAKLKLVISDFSGSKNAGKTLAIQAGPNTKITEMGLNAKDMDFLNLEEISAKRIALALGVPPVLLGFKGDSTFSNVEEANKSFYTQTIMPELEELRTAIEGWFKTLWGDALQLKLNYDEVPAVYALTKTKTDEAILLFEKGIITQDEVRELLGWEPLPAEDDTNIINNNETTTETTNNTEEEITDINEETPEE